MPPPIVPDLVELMVDTVQVESCTGSDRYGARSYAAPAQRQAYVIGRTRLVRGQDGRERVSTTQAILAGVFGVTVQDRYTLPARFSRTPQETDPTRALQARQPEAIAVDHQSDENGGHHETVYFE